MPSPANHYCPTCGIEVPEVERLEAKIDRMRDAGNGIIVHEPGTLGYEKAMFAWLSEIEGISSAYSSREPLSERTPHHPTPPGMEGDNLEALTPEEHRQRHARP